MYGYEYLRNATSSNIVKLVARSSFREFTCSDWDSFAGCTDECPLISDDDPYTIIVDGDAISVFYYNQEGRGLNVVYNRTEDDVFVAYNDIFDHWLQFAQNGAHH